MILTHHTPDGVRSSRHQSLTLYGLPDDAAAHATVASLSEIARLARAFTGADGAVVNLLPEGRQLTVASTLSDQQSEVPEEQSICATMLEQRPAGTIVVADLSLDPRFADNPYVDGEFAALRGYATAPLVGRERVAIGTLCVFWLAPRTLTPDEASMLDQLARAAVNVMDDARRDRRVVQRFPDRPVVARPAPAA